MKIHYIIYHIKVINVFLFNLLKQKIINYISFYFVSSCSFLPNFKTLNITFLYTILKIYNPSSHYFPLSSDYHLNLLLSIPCFNFKWLKKTISDNLYSTSRHMNWNFFNFFLILFLYLKTWFEELVHPHL